MALNPTIKPRPPQVHCYRCGSGDIAGICHHCARPMCQGHLPHPSRLVTWLQNSVLAPLGFAVHGGRQPAVHCHRCSHGAQIWLGMLDLAIILGGITLAGVYLQAGYKIGWLLLVCALFAAFSFRVALHVIDMDHPIAVLPRVDDLRVTESVGYGSATLTPGGYYAAVFEPVSGFLRLKFFLDPPRVGRGMRLWLKLRRRTLEDLHFNAGFLVLQGNIGTGDSRNDRRLSTSLPSPVISLVGSMSEVPSFLDPQGARAGEWTMMQTYRLLERLSRRGLPVRVVPSFRPYSDRRVLDIDVQFVEPGPSYGRLKPMRINKVMLYAPNTWRQRQSARPAREPEDKGSEEAKAPDREPANEALEGTDIENGELAGAGLEGEDEAQGQTGSTAQKANGAASPNERQTDGSGQSYWQLIDRLRVPISVDQARAGRRTIGFSFAREIPPKTWIRVFAQVTFEGALSGIDKVSLFSPLGTPLDLAEPSPVTTEINLTLDANLSSLSYQHVRVVPDSNNPQDAARTQPIRFERLAPDSTTLIKLTNTLSRREYYIQWVVENPPHSGRPADVLNHYWDIGGRKYEGVCPVDFHLVVTGDETRSTSTTSSPGTTFVTITVQGPYTTPGMADEVVKTWDELKVLIEKTLVPLQKPTPPDGVAGTTTVASGARATKPEPSGAPGPLGAPPAAESPNEASGEGDASTGTPKDVPSADDNEGRGGA